jgi:hypothetical protein
MVTNPVIDLNVWHHAIHQVTGDMALQFNRATIKDLQRLVFAPGLIRGQCKVQTPHFIGLLAGVFAVYRIIAANTKNIQ